MKEYAFSKDEFDTILQHAIIQSDLPRYQEIYRTIEPKSRYQVTVDDLKSARDMFIIDKGIPGASVLAMLLVGKYQDHLAVYRQLAIFKRVGVSLHYNTVLDWCNQAADVLSPLYELQKRQVWPSMMHTGTSRMEEASKEKFIEPTMGEFQATHREFSIAARYYDSAMLLVAHSDVWF